MRYKIKITDRAKMRILLLLCYLGYTITECWSVCSPSSQLVYLGDTTTSMANACAYTGPIDKSELIIPSWTEYLLLNSNSQNESIVNSTELEGLNVQYLRVYKNNFTTIPIVTTLKYLEIDNNLIPLTLIDMDSIHQMTGLETLNLKNSGIITLNSSGNGTILPHLTYLNLYGNNISTIDLNVLGNGEKLKDLNLKANQILNIHAPTHIYPVLTFLSLSFDAIKHSFDLKLLTSFPKLGLFDIRDGQLSSFLCGTNKCIFPSLYEIDMGYQKLKTLDLNHVITASNMHLLRVEYNEINFIIGLTQTYETTKAFYIYLHDNKLTYLNLSDFENIKTLKSLEVRNNNIKQVIPTKETFLKMHTFDLQYNKLTSINLTVFASMPKLYYLRLQYNSIEHITMSTLPANTQYLNLGYNQLTVLDFSVFQNFIFYHLYVRHNSISVIKPTNVTLTRLITIDMSNNQLSYVNLSWFNNIPNVKSLDIKDNSISQINVDMLWSFSSLSSFYISGNTIGDLEMSVWEVMPLIKEMTYTSGGMLNIIGTNGTLTGIKSVNFNDNGLTYLNLSLFSYMPFLESINVSKNNITNISISERNITQLNSINLEYNSLTRISLSVFDKILSLKYLILSHNSISEIVLNEYPLYNLLNIFLDNNDLLYFNTSWINNLPFLEYLSLRNNHITTIGTEYCHSRFDSISGGFKLYLDSNPLDCVQTLKWLKTCSYNIDIALSTGSDRTKCASPARVANQYFDQVLLELIDSDECDPVPCLNGGTCNDQLNAYNCTCKAGYKDDLCETDIDECQSNPCVHGNCTDGINKYTCLCETGYIGINCADIDNCEIEPCQNNGICVDLFLAYSCNCASGFEGNDCEIEIDECLSSPCLNNGACVDEVNAYSCTCVPGYKDVNCQTDINECLSNPCQNTGTCMDEVNGYTCVCQPGFTDSFCQIEINECISHPCLHGGTCTDKINSYTCTCIPGRNGTHCEIDIDECISMPCQHNGTCNDAINGYSCSCILGYTNENCQTDIDECHSNPCLNEGTCIDKINSYICACVPGYIATHCEIEENWKSLELQTAALETILNSFQNVIHTNNVELQTYVDMLSELKNKSQSLSLLYQPTKDQQEVFKDTMRFSCDLVFQSFQRIGYNITTVQRGLVLSNMTEVRDLVLLTHDIINNLTTTLLTSIQLGDISDYIYMKPYTVTYAKLTSSGLDNYMRATNYSSIQFTTNSTHNTDCLNVVTIFCEINPFMWNTTAENVTSSNIQINVTPCNSSVDITYVSRKKRSTLYSTSNTSQTIPDINYTAETTIHSDIMQYNVNVPKESKVKHHMIYDNNNTKPMCVSVFPDENNNLNVYLGFSPELDTTNFHSQFNVDWVEDNKNGNIKEVLKYDGIAAYNKNTTLCISVNLLQEHRAESLYVVVESSKECPNCINMSYAYSIYELNCEMWDDISEQWAIGQCQGSPNSNPWRVRFKSNLMGSIGAGLFVAPNSLDFLTVFDNIGQKLIDNVAVVTTLTLLIVLYVPFAILCRRWDKKDNLKWVILPLLDNDHRDEHQYEVHVYTGFKSNSGTDSLVSMILRGTDGDTGVRTLHVKNKKIFRTGEVSSFLLTTSYDLGDLRSLLIWHDNSGQSKKQNWFLSKIVIVHIASEQWYVFPCDRWIPNHDNQLQMLSITTESKRNGTDVFLNNLTYSLYNYHMWISMFYHKICSPFTRVQRLNCCWITLFILILCSAMWYGTSNKTTPQVALTIGIISITVHQIYTSTITAVMTIPVILFTIMVYDNIKQVSPILIRHMKSNGKKVNQEKGSHRCQLPHWCVYVAHCVVACTVLVCTFFTVLYSFEWGKEKSEEWLGSLVLCILHSVIFIAPFLIIAIALLYSFILKTDPSLADYEKILGRMKISPDTETEVMDALRIQRLKNERKARLHKEMIKIYQECFWQITLLLSVLFIINGNHDSNVYQQNQDLKNVFLQDVKEVRRLLETWDWISDVLLPNLYLRHQYNGQQVTTYEKKFIRNGYGMRFGPPNIRQIRVIKDKCTILSELSSLISRCIKDYSSDTMDRRSYLPGWNPLLNISLGQNHTYDNAFLYQNHTRETNFWGDVNTYPPGGYIVNFGTTYAEAKSVIEELIHKNWLDKYTKALFIRFNVWNANTNLFNEFILTFEFPSVGLIQHQVSINSVQLYRYVGAEGLGNLIVELIATIFMLTKTIAVIMQLIKQKKQYFFKPNNLATILSISLFHTAMGFYIWRSVLTVQTIEFMMNNRDEIVNFQTLTSVNDAFLLILGTTAFILQLQLLQILRHVSLIAKLGKTLFLSSKTLISSAVFLAIISIAFITFFLKMYGSVTYEYHSLLVTSNSLILGTMGKFKYDSLIEGSGAFGTVMFILYLLLQGCIFINLMCTLLIDFLNVINRKGKGNNNEVIQYMLKWLNDNLNPFKKDTSATPAPVSSNHKYDQLQERIDTLLIILQLKITEDSSDIDPNVLMTDEKIFDIDICIPRK